MNSAFVGPKRNYDPSPMHKQLCIARIIEQLAIIRRGFVRKVIHILFYTVLAGYLLILLDTVFFARTGSSFRSVNIIPFASIQQYINVDNGIRVKLVDMNIWGNILMFVPLGIYSMIFAKKKTIARNLAIVAAASLFIEIIQYVFALGSSDIDDLILNTAGGLIGIIIYTLLYKIWKDAEKVKTVIAILSAIVGIPVILLSILLYLAN